MIDTSEHSARRHRRRLRRFRRLSLAELHMGLTHPGPRTDRSGVEPGGDRASAEASDDITAVRTRA